MSSRLKLFQQLSQTANYDIAIIGGGATGLGVALDATVRGFKVALFESHDFAKGTSSRATKLVHGGVRYLAQGNISLVREALHERTTLLANAPHIAQPLPFVMPSYAWWEAPFYGVGLKMYDLLAGKAGLGVTEFLSRAETLKLLPNARESGLTGGVKYWDGQFDDARLALALAQTAAQRGALLINYCAVKSLIHENGKVSGLLVQDQETGTNYKVKAACVINAAGVWVDEFRQMDGEQTKRPVKAMVAPSQGTHLVVDREFMPSDHAILIPKTADGRVLFIVPWLGKLILGTTDSPRHDLAREPTAFKDDTGFILGEAAKYLTRAPQRSDVKSIWVGLRPLVKPPDEAGRAGDGASGSHTKKLSREHTILVSKSGLVTVTGGKWTTYRAMAEDVLDHAFEAKLIERRAGHVTVNLPLSGSTVTQKRISDPPGLHMYGSAAAQVQSMPGATNLLCPGLSEAMVRYAARFEYARTVEDMLARRSRLLFLDAQLAASVAQAVATILQEETGIDPQLSAFLALAKQYATLPE
jgi:glycerol-3-phosphate dehydrogenase